LHKEEDDDVKDPDNVSQSVVQEEEPVIEVSLDSDSNVELGDSGSLSSGCYSSVTCIFFFLERKEVV
jgi:hypothetical protein